jgi:hypothetical protein
LHPKFDIQGVQKVMNLAIKDRAMWLVDVWSQFLSKFEEAQKWYKTNVDEHQKVQPNFKVGDYVWLWKQHIKIIRPSKRLDHQRLGPFLIVKQINDVAFQFKLPDSMIIHLVFHVSLLEHYHVFTILERIYDPPPPIEINGEHEHEVEDILDSGISYCQF